MDKMKSSTSSLPKRSPSNIQQPPSSLINPTRHQNASPCKHSTRLPPSPPTHHLHLTSSRHHNQHSHTTTPTQRNNKTNIMAEATPRITAPYLDQFSHRTVRILGKVRQLRGEEATVDAGGQIRVHQIKVLFSFPRHQPN